MRNITPAVWDSIGGSRDTHLSGYYGYDLAVFRVRDSVYRAQIKTPKDVGRTPIHESEASNIVKAKRQAEEAVLVMLGVRQENTLRSAIEPPLIGAALACAVILFFYVLYTVARFFNAY